MRWLVTGAGGLLGANAGLALRGAIGVTRTGAAIPGYGEVIAADLEEPGRLAGEIERRRPAVVLHAGAMATHEGCEADPNRARRVNAEATGVLAAAAADAGSRFVYVSTDAVFDGSRGGYAEEDEPSPFSVYGETKLEGEQRARDHHPDPLIARVNFFGWSPSGHRSILEFFVNELSAGRRVQGYSDFVVTTLYVGHLVDALVTLVDEGATGTFHLGSSDRLSKAGFGLAVARGFALDPSLIEQVSAAQSGRAIGRARDLSMSTVKAARVLGPLPTQGAGIEAAATDSGRRALLRS